MYSLCIYVYLIFLEFKAFLDGKFLGNALNTLWVVFCLESVNLKQKYVSHRFAVNENKS